MIRVGILGASGYTGAELVRILLRHPSVRLTLLTAERQAGKPPGDVFPQLARYGLPDLIKIDQANWDDVDLVFCALPHGTTQEIVAKLPKRLKVVDLSADFRLSDPATYEKWYGHPHQALEIQAEAVYGLTERYRERVKTARVVANPGCYPTCSLTPLLPLVAAGAIDPDEIIIDAKSGVSGAGRDAKRQNLFCEVSEGFHAYGVATHRHGPEIEQELSLAAGRPVTVTFTPHLVPMNRGMLATIYVRPTDGRTADDLRDILKKTYFGEPFVDVTTPPPQTRAVRGANICQMAVVADRAPGRVVIVSVIDNLVKGASGQAVQNMNVMLGLEETTGVDMPPMFP